MTSGQRPTPPARGNTTKSDHIPAQPSSLRKSYTSRSDSPPLSPGSSPRQENDESVAGLSLAGPSEPHRTPGTETTPLLRGLVDLREHAHDGPCNHGTFSPRPLSPTSDRSYTPSITDTESDVGNMPIIDGLMNKISGKRNWRRTWVQRIKSKKMSTSSALAERHGIKDDALMYEDSAMCVRMDNANLISRNRYLSYYLPVLVWSREYKWSYLKGDFIAAITVAGMYVPMALSLADNLAHVPPVYGLYSFVFNPFVYAMLGSCPSMVVGPEAAGSLLVGSVVKMSVDLGRGNDDDAELQAKICGIVAGMADATVFIAGVARLGFLDSVLSRPFLRGFISAIGVVIAVDQLVPELGLSRLQEKTPGVGHGSSVDKLWFIFGNLDKVHRLTFALAGISFAVIMLFRELKKRLTPRYPSVAYFPDRFLIVVLSAWLTYYFEWDQQGVAVLGEIKAASGHLFSFRWPFSTSHIKHIRDAMGTSFLIALLGFFESSVAAKSLGGTKAFPDIQLSPNWELVALGAANLVGACFMSLPAFGGYGRSKVNKATGGVSPMSSIFLSTITTICILFLLPYFYYLPVSSA